MSFIKVYHFNIAKDQRFTDARESAVWPKDFSMVAIVGQIKGSIAQNREHAFEKTNSIHCYWGENEGVSDLNGKCRSTSVGDVVVVDDKAFRCEPAGWSEIE